MKHPSTMKCWLVSQAFVSSSLCLLIILLICWTSEVQCQRKSFDLHELTHDSPVLNPDTQIKLSVPAGEHLQYNLRAIEPNHTVRLFLAKPFKVREIETELNIELVKLNETNFLPYIVFMNVNVYHRGNYSLYIFLYDLEGHLVNYSRVDFNLVVEDLKPEWAICQTGKECDSGHCRFGRCVCNADHPVFFNNSCASAKNYNENCTIDEECQEFGGRYAECYPGWGRCRCKKDTAHIKISQDLRHCVPIAHLNHSCLYSMQCGLQGDNRYCNGHYKCQCLPGYRLEQGRFCTGNGHGVLVGLGSMWPSLLWILVVVAAVLVAVVLLVVLYCVIARVKSRKRHSPTIVWQLNHQNGK